MIEISHQFTCDICGDTGIHMLSGHQCDPEVLEEEVLALRAQVDELKAKILEQEAQIVTLIGAAEDLLNETTRKNAEGWTSLGLAGEELENAIAAIITGEKT